MRRRDSVELFLEDLRQRFDTAAMVEELDGELARLHAALAESMPVRTGLLRGSGQSWSTHDEDEWVGTIEFGVGVPYAVYVLNRQPANEYDALVAAWEPLFEEHMR